MEDEINWDTVSKPKYLLYSSLTGCALDCVSYPFDLLKTRVQSQGWSYSSVSLPHYDNLLDAFRKVLRDEGVKGLYRGYSVRFAAVAPEQVLNLAGYEWSKTRLHPILGENLLSHAISGAFATFLSSLAWVPSDIVAQRLQLQNPSSPIFRTPFQMVGHMWKVEGLSGFFCGFWPTMATELPMGAIAWATYESAKFHINNMVPESYRDGHVAHIGAGLCAGVVAPTLMAPVEVSKTRLQIVRHLAEERGVRGVGYSNVFEVAREILVKEGWRQFYRGVVPSILSRSSQLAVVFSCYEFVRSVSVISKN